MRTAGNGDCTKKARLLTRTVRLAIERHVDGAALGIICGSLRSRCPGHRASVRLAPSGHGIRPGSSRAIRTGPHCGAVRHHTQSLPREATPWQRLTSSAHQELRVPSADDPHPHFLLDLGQRKSDEFEELTVRPGAGLPDRAV